MDSLLANYASSDEEEHEEQPPQARQITPAAEPEKWEAKAGDGKDEDLRLDSSSKRGGIFKSLPLPKSSLFNSLPPPKSQSLHNHKPEEKFDRRAEANERDEISKPKSSSSLFSSLPPPKSSEPSPSSTSRKVVQFRPPMMMNAYAGRVDDDDEEEEEDEEDRKRKRSKASISTTSASSFLSSIPAPKHSATLGALPTASGMGRRSMLETDAPASSASTVGDEVANTNNGYMEDQSSEIVYDYSIWTSGSESNAYYSGYGAVSDGNQHHDVNEESNGLSGESYAYYGAYGVGTTEGDDANVNRSTGSYEAADYSYVNEQNVGYTNYEGSYGDYGNNTQYENNWADATALPEASVETVLQLPGKRGRKDVPPQIIEVKQDELMKNRPREDQVKLTGIAFGPGHQPPASSKGKPTKLHKRKHQIGSLYFDLKQKETELAERRSQGFLTKAQTQAKYGW